MLDVLLLTSAQQRSPDMVLEATCLGVSVVATESGGTGEAVFEGRTGYVISEHGRSRVAIAGALAEAVIPTPPARRRLPLRCQQSARR